MKFTLDALVVAQLPSTLKIPWYNDSINFLNVTILVIEVTGDANDVRLTNMITTIVHLTKSTSAFNCCQGKSLFSYTAQTGQRLNAK